MRMRPCALLLLWAFLPCAVLTGPPADAQTYLSVEPIPSQAVVGTRVLESLLTLDPEVRKRWAELLLECGLVQGVLDALASDGTITTLNGANTILSVAAGGFEGQTNPTYVFTMIDSGINALSTEDIATVANALGYVLSQDETIFFSPVDSELYDFPFDYVTVTFLAGPPSITEAQGFFEHVGTIDPELFTGLFAGYTQIGAALFFLQPATEVQQFIDGMFAATQAFPDIEYAPFDADGEPTTAVASVTFPGNNWSTNPEGSEYLVNVAQDPAADLGRLPNLNDWRQFHHRAALVLSRQASNGRFEVNGLNTLERIFRCRR